MIQLTLPVTPPGSPTFETFSVGGNGVALQTLRSVDEPMVYLWGESGSGKTHLLRALCAEAAGQGQQALILDLADYQRLDPRMLQGLEALEWVCLDNAQAIAAVDDWEQGLFDLCNRVRERGSRLRVAARSVPGDLGVVLPDLVSRLEWGPVFTLEPLDDAGKMDALKLHAASRSLKMPESVREFLLRRAPRDNHGLLAMLERLDKGSLTHKRRLTVPFVKQVLGL